MKMVSSHKQSVQISSQNRRRSHIERDNPNTNYPKYNNQLGTITKEHRNPAIVYYDVALKYELENEQIIHQVDVPRQANHLRVGLYDSQ